MNQPQTRNKIYVQRSTSSVVVDRDGKRHEKSVFLYASSGDVDKFKAQGKLVRDGKIVRSRVMSSPKSITKFEKEAETFMKGPKRLEHKK